MNPLQGIIDQLLANSVMGAGPQPQQPQQQGFQMVTHGQGGVQPQQQQPQQGPPGAPPGAQQPPMPPGAGQPPQIGNQPMPTNLQQQIAGVNQADVDAQRMASYGNVGKFLSGLGSEDREQERAVAMANLDAWKTGQKENDNDVTHATTFKAVHGMTKDPEAAKYVADLMIAKPEVGQKVMEQIAQMAFPEPKPGHTTNIHNPPPLKAGWQNIMDENGRVVRQERVPGGPAEQEYEAEITAQRSRWRNVRTKADAQAKRVRNIFKDVGYDTAGIIGEVMSYVPGTGAFDLKKEAETILANVAFGTMEELKMASPSGATGLGQVQIREFEALQNSLGNLAQGQSPENLKEGLIGVLLFAERQKAYSENPEKYDAMSDKDYFKWVDTFNQSVVDSVSEPAPREGVYNPQTGKVEYK